MPRRSSTTANVVQLWEAIAPSQPTRSTAPPADHDHQEDDSTSSSSDELSSDSSDGEDEETSFASFSESFYSSSYDVEAASDESPLSSDGCLGGVGEGVGVAPERFVELPANEEVMNELMCSLCLHVLCDPHALPCQHTFCKACILPWLRRAGTCPICSAKARGGVHCLQPVRKVHRLLSCMKFSCNHREAGCGAVLHFEQLEQHQRICCYRPPYQVCLRVVKKNNKNGPSSYAFVEDLYFNVIPAEDLGKQLSLQLQLFRVRRGLPQQVTWSNASFTNVRTKVSVSEADGVAAGTHSEEGDSFIFCWRGAPSRRQSPVPPPVQQLRRGRRSKTRAARRAAWARRRKGELSSAGKWRILKEQRR